MGLFHTKYKKSLPNKKILKNDIPFFSWHIASQPVRYALGLWVSVTTSFIKLASLEGSGIFFLSIYLDANCKT